MDVFLDTLSESLGNFGSALVTTIIATVFGALLALVLAFVLGILSRSRHIVVRALVRIVVEFFRGTSLFVQLFWLFYALPLLGVKIAGFTIPGVYEVRGGLLCGILAFGLNFGAYGAEVVRGAINAVPKPQWEGAVALNMSRYQRMRLVILPQAWVGMIPPFNNLLIQLLKSTPLLSLVIVADLTFEGEQLRGATGATTLTYLLLLILYFVLAYVFTLLMNALETAAKARLGRGTGLRGLFKLAEVDASGDTMGAGAGPAGGL